jgi:hypothetical protein
VTDQLRLGDKPRPATRERHTCEQHLVTKRYFALAWADGEITGIAGPYAEPPAAETLPGLDYTRNRDVLKRTTQDMLNRVYARWIPDEELAS